jgi:hypothetical protein
MDPDTITLEFRTVMALMRRAERAEPKNFDERTAPEEVREILDRARTTAAIAALGPEQPTLPTPVAGSHVRAGDTAAA